MLFSCNMKMEHLLENERAKALVDQFFPGLCSLAASHAQAKELSVQQLVRYAGLPGAAEKLPTLDLALQELNLTERTVSASEEKLMERFRSIW